MNPVTTPELAKLIAPFVGKRLRGDLSASIEIDAPGQHFVNASVRSLDDEHVGVFFYNTLERIPLAAIRRVIIRGVEDGNFTSCVAYEHVGQRALVAA